MRLPENDSSEPAFFVGRTGTDSPAAVEEESCPASRSTTRTLGPSLMASALERSASTTLDSDSNASDAVATTRADSDASQDSDVSRVNDSSPNPDAHPSPSMPLATPQKPPVRSTTTLARPPHPTAEPRSNSSSAIPVDEALAASYAILESIRLPNGLYLASPSADYSKVWLRDTVYEVMPYVDKETHHYELTYHSLLDILRRHEWKVDAIARSPPVDGDEYIHARFHPDTLREFSEPWGNKQNDAVGAVLFGIAEGLRHGKKVLRGPRDRRLVDKLVQMLVSLEYWRDSDNGMWEEAEELHASSIGACLGAMIALRREGFDIPDIAITEGRRALDALLPRESRTKACDLALLSLVWPYRVTTHDQTLRIVRNVEASLLRERGVIRYEGDSYYSPLADAHGRDKPWKFYHGSEAEWTFGLPWLSLAWLELGEPASARDYLDRTRAVMKSGGLLPELYFSGTDEENPNTPLGWSQAMFILATEALAAKSRDA